MEFLEHDSLQCPGWAESCICMVYTVSDMSAWRQVIRTYLAGLNPH